MSYAHIALNIPVPQTFTYHIPAMLVGQVQVGQVVRVPFRTAESLGVVVGLSEEAPPFETKPILSLFENQPLLTPFQLDLAQWLAKETLSPLGQCLWLMLPPAFAQMAARKRTRPQPSEAIPPALTLAPPLTESQQAVWKSLKTDLSAGGHVVLLHGVTGSGKTEIYLRAIAETLAGGRSAIFLVPEIALTPQTLARVRGRFGERVVLIHSTLSHSQRYETWRRLREGGVWVVVGARSALFAPLEQVGLVILDEEHDPSYKQETPVAPPHYHARTVAIEYMRRQGGTVILGSATPDVVSYDLAQRGHYHLLELPERVLTGSRLPPVQVVDMRVELKAGNRSIFSRALHAALQNTLSQRQQAILFMNRRGTSSYIFCRDCGEALQCKRCLIPLTYHSAEEHLLCHHCGYHQPLPSTCPHCASQRIRQFGLGTQQIETEIKKLFPQARVLRWDKDSATKRDAHQNIFDTFNRHEADILVGTQMVAKGLDFPHVTLVGVVSADVGLHLPHYRAPEMTFQVLMQVAGRTGRGAQGGRVILQTYQPEHYAILAAARHDYAAFYQRELAYRHALAYPPFVRLVRVLFRDPIDERARQSAQRAADFLIARINAAPEVFSDSHVLGATPCFFRRQDGLYRWQVLIRTVQAAALLEGLDLGTQGWIELDPLDTL